MLTTTVEEEVLKDLQALNQKLRTYRQILGDHPIEADLAQELARELEKLFQYGIVLLPPEEKPGFCPRCGQRIGT
jgi:hypothetical protein